jgi:hypothetical protein
VLWRPLIQQEWRDAVAKFDIGAPTHSRFNISGWRAWWSGSSIKVVLRDFCYLSEYCRFAPSAT